MVKSSFWDWERRVFVVETLGIGKLEVWVEIAR